MNPLKWLKNRLFPEPHRFFVRNDERHALLFYEGWREGFVRYLDPDEYDKPIWEILGTTEESYYGKWNPEKKTMEGGDSSRGCVTIIDAKALFGYRVKEANK